MNKRLSHNTRTILLHAKRKWPSVITSILWPFCYKCAEERHNLLDLNAEELSPVEVLLGHTEELVADDFRAWGCPVFVLDANLQTGHGIGPSKWNPRSRTGVYLGHSPVHTGNVALVLNLQTGHVSPQYHVVFDDKFLTVPYLQSPEIPPNWADLVAIHTAKATDQSFNLASTWYEGNEASRDDTIPQTSAEPTLVRQQDRPFIELGTIGLRKSP
eukprot:5539529-Ditylum_brightwellii.AAC.1